jgi:hypothetical protein
MIRWIGAAQYAFPAACGLTRRGPKDIMRLTHRDGPRRAQGRSIQ